ncbi:MAG: hypothetical protein DHS20C08_04900 [Rhodomicrobium sp.]|nr:MAG: hypothetical protein DHS20C08_04900 [Rhodomicrobium sp.]
MDYTSPAILGLYLGLAIGLLDYIVLTVMGQMMVKRGIEKNAKPEEMRQVTRFMRTLALLSLIAFPIVGYFAGPYVFGTV